MYITTFDTPVRTGYHGLKVYALDITLLNNNNFVLCFVLEIDWKLHTLDDYFIGV
jgi:hypothetical protein